jgi:hypothetical protein
MMMAIVIPAAKIAIKNQRSIVENPWQTFQEASEEHRPDFF